LTTLEDQPGRPDAGRAARGAIWLGLSAALVKGGQTAVLLVVAALLAPSALGVLALGALVTNVAQEVSDLGASQALVYWRGDPSRAARTALTISAATSVVAAAAIWATAPWIDTALHAGGDGTWVIRGMISVLPCYGIASVSQELLRRDLAFVRRVIPNIVPAIIGGALSIALAESGHGLGGIVAGQIVQGVLTVLITWMVGRVLVPGWSAPDARALLHYGGPLTLGSLLGLALLNVDYIMVARVLGSTALGEYSLAFRLAYLPYLNIAFVIAGAAFPYLCRLVGADVGRALERVVTATMTLLLPVCAGIALFADQLELLGAKWAPAVPAVRWLALYAALLSLAQLMYTALNSVGRPRATMQLRLLHLILLVIVLAVAVHHGIEAVAVGQVVGGSVAALTALLSARRQVSGLRLDRLARTLLPAAAGVSCMAIAALVAHRALPATVVSVSGLGGIGIAALAAYAVPVLILGRSELTRTARALARRS